jgi:hypothetical protein
MTEPTVDALMADLVERLDEAMPELLGRITYGPPESTPMGLCIWCEYGPVVIEYSVMEVTIPSIRVIVSVNRSGDYPGEYRTVTEYAQKVHWALRPECILADEAVVVGLYINPAGGSSYANQQDALVTCVIDVLVENKQQSVPEVLT